MDKQKKAKIEQVHIDEAARLKSLFAARPSPQMSQGKFGETFDIGSQALVWQYLNARIPLNLEQAVRFARGLGCSVSEFSPRLAAELAELRDAAHTESPNLGDLPPSANGQRATGPAESPDNAKGEPMPTAQILKIAASNTRDTITIPQYDAGGAMGHGLVLPEQPGVIERWTVSREWLEKNARGFTSAGNLCIVTGFGPSMRPMFNPGDPLLVDTGVKNVLADGIYFFRIGNEGFIKQLQKIPTEQGLIYRAKSANPDYDAFEITAGMDFEVLGRVIRVWCGTDF